MMPARVRRDPLSIARLLARRYPETPGISYIPALAWVETLRLAAIDNDTALRAKVFEQTLPWVAGGKPLFTPSPRASAGQAGDRIQLTALAGTKVVDDLAHPSRPPRPNAPQ